MIEWILYALIAFLVILFYLVSIGFSTTAVLAFAGSVLVIMVLPWGWVSICEWREGRRETSDVKPGDNT